jgi:hypothetical protein
MDTAGKARACSLVPQDAPPARWGAWHAGRTPARGVRDGAGRTPDAPPARWGAWHAGRTPVRGVRDGAGRTPARRTHTRGVPTMDGGWVHGDILRVHPRLFGARAWSLDVAVCQRPSIHPPRQAGFASDGREPCANKTNPVHSRDAACPRPARLSASGAITQLTRRWASCTLVRVRCHHAAHAPMGVLPDVRVLPDALPNGSGCLPVPWRASCMPGGVLSVFIFQRRTE